MRARDPNGSSWYVLRYPVDFRSGDADDAPFRAESLPWLSPELFHDAGRHATELRPADPPAELLPPPGIAVEPGGDVFRVDERGCLVRRRCDGTEAPFPCEPDVVRRPAGLALDRRGWLYVADPGARRVVLLDARSGAVVGVLAAGSDPVDVAVAASGTVAVADRGGSVHRFSPALRPRGTFAPRNAAGLPASPRPIAVMFDATGALLVADARYPRLLRFHPDGTPDGEVELTALAAGVPTLELRTLQRLYGPRLPAFLAGPGCDCPPSDGPARLTAVHLAVRVARLALGRTWTTEGLFISRRLDGGAPATEWHKVVVDADLPEGSRLWVETATAERPTALPLAWDVPRDASERALPFLPAVPDQLVQSPPGRYLWLRARFSSNGRATPSLRSIRVYYPRNSPLELLPAHWQRDPGARHFLQGFLALIERESSGIESRYERFLHDLNPDAAPSEWIEWLGALIDLAFDPSWPLERRRALLRAAMELYRRRGTPQGIRRYLEIYSGTSPVVVESFLSRPGRSAYLGVPGTTLGCTLRLCGCKPDRTPDELLYESHAHRFAVVVPLLEACSAEVMVPVIDRIVETNKPAHTEHIVEPALPDARVGLQSRVGIDFLLGAPSAPALRVVPDRRTPVEGAALGVDSVLGDAGTGSLGGRGILEL